MSVTYRTGGLSYHWQGNNTKIVPIDLFHENLRRLCHQLRTSLNTPDNAWIILEGGNNIPLYNTDATYGTFRQEPFFMWIFGIPIPDCIGLVEISSGDAYLFIPQPSNHYIDWIGQATTPEDYKLYYKLTNVYYREELFDFLRKRVFSATLLTLNGINSDSGLAMKQSKLYEGTKFRIKDNILYNEMCELRAIKTAYEIDVMRYVAEITSLAHKSVMKYVKPGMMEYQCEACFLQCIYDQGGCRLTAFTPNCSSGPNTAILHYGHEDYPNNRKITKKDLCLFNMGASYCGYASDITCTFPASGIFTDNQKLLYNVVLECSRAILSILKPGQSWVTMHKLANNILLQNLKEISILKGSIEQMIKYYMASYFQPHGLGHLVGLDVHDVGGYLPGYPARSKDSNLKYLRTARILEAGMVITVEPGCYFIPKRMNDLRNNSDLTEFVNLNILNNFIQIGGVRIGDIVHITNDGCEVLSKVPRTIDDIEEFMGYVRLPKSATTSETETTISKEFDSQDSGEDDSESDMKLQ